MNNIRTSDRRDNSQIKPRIFLFLELILLAISSYILFTFLRSLGIATMPIAIVLIGANCYFFTRLFFKCKVIAGRSKFRFEKSFY